MSKKNRPKRRQEIDFAARSRRQRDKGDAKGALKDAKMCFRLDPGVENRRLLEETLVCRVEQLQRLRMLDDARVVLKELVDFKPTSPLVVAQLGRLQAMVGAGGAGSAEIWENDRSLLVEMVDQAVVDDRAATPQYGDVPQEIAAVRTALRAVEQNDDASAELALAGISRKSPLADWRLFVRGLSAFYRRDDERAQDNWRRLDAEREASRIAGALQKLASIGSGEPGVREDEETIRLTRRLSLRDDTESLRDLHEQWQQRNLRGFFDRFRNLCLSRGKSDPVLIAQITDFVWKQAVVDANNRILKSLQRVAPAPPIDPAWHRAEALLAESSQETYANDVEAAWVRYAQGVTKMEFLPEAERSLAIGLVHRRLARKLAGYGGFDFRHPELSDSQNEEEAEEIASLLGRACHHYRRSIEKCPSLTSSYLELATLHEALDQGKMASRVLDKLLFQEPSNYDAAFRQGNYYLDQDDPANAQRYVDAVHLLRPRDPLTTALVWNHRITTVRCAAIGRQFELARQEIDQAIDVAPADIEPYMLDVMRAGVELKAKNQEAADRWIDVAQAKTSDPTPIWLQLSCIASRMRVARDLKKRVDDRLKTLVNNELTSESAGSMARFLLRMRGDGAKYSGRATHERLVAAALRRSCDIAWQEPDMRSACQFLLALRKDEPLSRRLVAMGLERFPHIPHYHYWTGLQAFGGGLSKAGQSLDAFKEALRLHDRGPVRLDAQDLDIMKDRLALVADYLERQRRCQSRFELGDDEDDYEYGEYDDEVYDYDEADDEIDHDCATTDFAKHIGAAAALDVPDVDALIKTMPAVLRKQLNGMARELGFDARELLQKMMNAMRTP